MGRANLHGRSRRRPAIRRENLTVIDHDEIPFAVPNSERTCRSTKTEEYYRVFGSGNRCNTNGATSPTIPSSRPTFPNGPELRCSRAPTNRVHSELFRGCTAGGVSAKACGMTVANVERQKCSGSHHWPQFRKVSGRSLLTQTERDHRHFTRTRKPHGRTVFAGRNFADARSFQQHG